MYKGIYTYAWDLIDEGTVEAVARFRDVGLNTITLAAAYHAGKFIRPHGKSGKVYFPEDGTVYFRPDMGRYGAIKPTPGSLLDDHDPFADIKAAAPDMRRVAWTVCMHNTALGQRHPEFTVRNAFGDGYPYSLCPAVPEVRDYIVTLCRDMAERQELDGVLLESPGFMPFDHGFHHEFFLLPMNRWAKWLLALCFAPACIAGAKAAGIDAERLAADVRHRVEHFLADPRQMPDSFAYEWMMADLIVDPEWGAFLRWRCDVVTSLVAEIRDALPKQTELAVIPTVQRPTAGCWLEGSDLAGLAKAADALEVPAYQANVAEVWHDTADVRRRAGDDARLHLILRPTHPDLGDGAETAAAAAALKEFGAEGLAFYNYGHFPLSGMERIREALAVFDDVV